MCVEEDEREQGSLRYKQCEVLRKCMTLCLNDSVKEIDTQNEYFKLLNVSSIFP